MRMRFSEITHVFYVIPVNRVPDDRDRFSEQPWHVFSSAHGSEERRHVALSVPRLPIVFIGVGDVRDELPWRCERVAFLLFFLLQLPFPT